MTPFLPPAAVRDIVANVQVFLDVDDTPPMRDRPHEFAALQLAISRRGARCIADDRYTADPSELTSADLIGMGQACATCPAGRACDEFAVAARPAAGFWAGVPYPRRDEDHS